MTAVVKAMVAVERVNDWSGKALVLIAPIVILITVLEVVLRYVFNSPTNWVHESSTLLFGMQYILSGAYAHYWGAHVKVDILHGKLSRRGQAWLDSATSVFFFLFVGALAFTSWTFFLDSWAIREHSFTDWGPPYYPVKFTIPVAFAMLGLQGLVKLARDLHLAFTGRRLA